MILKIFSVYDSKAEAFMPPFHSQSTGQAVRSFGDTANDPQSQLCKHAGDFTLFELGTFDDSNGKFEQYATPKSLGTALEHKTPTASERAAIFAEGEKALGVRTRAAQ